MNRAARKKEAEYGKKAAEHVAKLPPQDRRDLPTIQPETAEWNAWERYFVEFLGFYPWAMKHAMQGHQADKEGAAMTVPAQWPEWFDSRYSSVNAA